MSGEKPVTMRLSPIEWWKLIAAIGVQLIAIVTYVQGIDYKATDARNAASEARVEVRDLRDKTDTKLDVLRDEIKGVGRDVSEIKGIVKQGR